jgi:hypothetical protein
MMKLPEELPTNFKRLVWIKRHLLHSIRQPRLPQSNGRLKSLPGS